MGFNDRNRADEICGEYPRILRHRVLLTPREEVEGKQTGSRIDVICAEARCEAAEQQWAD